MRRLSLVLPAMLVTFAAHAASLRGATSLDRPMVRIADLFDGAGAAADRVLGPGPAPGERIVVEAPQLAAIARQFGVDWRPASPADRIVIDRPGRELPREAVMTPLRAALTDAGASGDSDITLPGFTPPLIGMGDTPGLTIEQLSLDRDTGRFTAMLVIAPPDGALTRFRLAGQVEEMTSAVVPTHRLLPGTVIGPADVTVQRVRALPWLADRVHTPEQAIGLAVRRMEPAGQPLPVADLGPPIAVQKGARVTMELQAPGLSISGVGLAAEQGAVGDQIRVLNPASHSLVTAEVIAADLVRVVPLALPRATRLATEEVVR